MRALILAVYLIVGYGAIHHDAPWQLLPLTLLALGLLLMVSDGGARSQDEALGGVMVGFPILILGVVAELIWLLGWLLF